MITKFVSGLLPSLNRKLCGKEYSSFAHAVEAAQIEEWRLGEAERRMHGEDWEQHGRGRERSREQSWTKWQVGLPLDRGTLLCVLTFIILKNKIKVKTIPVLCVSYSVNFSQPC